MPVLDRSFTGNKPVYLAAQMKWHALKKHFWGKFAKFNTPEKTVIAKPGNEPKPIQSPIVMQHELERRMGDVMEIPLLRNLENLPTIGMDQLAGHEELQKLNHVRVPIDIVRTAVKPQEGIMSKQTTKELQLLKRAYPQLLRHYAETNEYLGASYGFYYSHSWNILQSSRFSGNNQNIKAVSHPHVFIAGKGKVSYGVSNYPGTAGYETQIGTDIGNMVDTNVFDTQYLSGLKAHEQVMRTDPLIMKDGNPLWLIVAHPYMVSTLEADEKFRNTVAQTHAIQLAKDNPLLVGCKYIWGGFAIFQSDTAVWPVSVSGGKPVWGPTTITNLKSFKNYSTYNKFAAILLGNNAMFKATGQPLEFKKRMADYDEIIGIAYRAVEGYSRGDFWNEDDGTRGDNLINDGSAVLIAHAEAPAM